MKPLFGSVLVLVVAMAACRSAAPHPRWGLVVAEGSPIRGVSRANAIVAGDFDRDGRNDLAVLGGDPGELLVLRNVGAGRFEPSPQGVVAAGKSASGLGVGDVDSDGAADLVVTRHDDFDVLVLLSNGDGTFREPLVRSSASGPGTPHSHGVALVDVDVDGRLDLLQAQSEQNVVVVLLGDGAGGFTPAPGSPYRAGEHPYRVLVADLDGDGKLDLATPNAIGQDLTIFLGRGRGEFSPPRAPIALEGRALALAGGDVDADGHVDLVVNYDDVDALDVWRGDGTGSFRRSRTLAAPGRVYGQSVVDLDGDGIEDVVAPCIDAEAVAVWPGRRGGPADDPLLFETPGTDSQVLAIAHLDEDELLDVVTAGWERATLTVLRGRAR
jgi:hypothetical protein